MLFPGLAAAAQVDPAPIPQEVVQRLVFDRAARSDPSAQVLRRELDETDQLLDSIESGDWGPGSELPDRGRLDGRRMQLAGKLNELRAAQQSIRARLMDLKARSSAASTGASDHDELAAKIDERFAALRAALEGVQQGKTRLERRAALRQTRALLHEMHGRVTQREQALNPGQPWELGQHLRPARPQPQASRLPAYMTQRSSPGNTMYAMQGAGLLAALPDPTPADAAACAYTAADLAATEDAPINAEIRALAERLGHSAPRIYEYVANEIAFEPYYGSLKGALGALYTKAGGPSDQASLLIALLRASNIPARYVKGQIALLDPVRLDQNGRGPRWFGVKSYDAAAKVLLYGQYPLFPGWGVVSDATTLQPVGIRLIHVWVEACVPYAQYRGARIDNTGHRWVPLDPSFKDKTYQPGLATNRDFDYAGYTAARTNQLPHERYEQQIEADIKQLAPNFGNNTLEDVGYIGKIVRRQVDVLPITTPYDVEQFVAWDDGNATAEAATLPDQHRYKFKIGLKSSADATLLPQVTLSLPATALKRVTLAFKGADAANQTRLDSWLTQATSAPLPCSPVLNAVPVLRVEGAEQAAGTLPVPFCTDQNALHKLELRVELAELGDQASNPVRAVTRPNIFASNYHALHAYAFQPSDRLLAERAARLLASVRATPQPNANLEETEAEFLHLVGLKYLRYISDAARRIGDLTATTGQVGVHVGVVSTATKVDYLFDLPFAVNRSNLLVDMAAIFSPVDSGTGSPSWRAFQLTGYSGSAYESYVWQENARVDAVSSVRGVQFARETGIEVMTLTSSNFGDCAQSSSNCWKLTHNADSSLNYSIPDVNRIKTEFIDKQYTVTIPRSKIRYSDWVGGVFIAEKQAFPYSMSLEISGGYAGGYSVGLTLPYSYDPVKDTGYQYLIPTSPGGLRAPAFLNNANNFGWSPFVTTGGDPVNMVTGNMYHTERDLSLKGRGGLPIVFERFYNSRKPQDGPLGYGWTHSFNHFLEFRDDNADAAVNPADTDGLTSTIAWVDGTGAEKLISANGAAGGVPAGSYPAPAGFYFQFTKNADGTYNLKEKNGLTYTFEAAAGTVNQRAKLTRVEDRNGNPLNLAYTSGRLSTVTDGLNRAIVFDYQGGTRVREIRDWTGRKFQYDYDAQGNLTAFKNPLAVAGQQDPVTYEYYTLIDGANVDHAMKRYLLPRGNWMRFEYYMNGRVFRHSNALGETMTFTYNDFRRETVSVNERGFERRLFFDERGNPLRVEEENGAIRAYEYGGTDPFLRSKEVSPLGHVTRYDHDAAGNLIQITLPSGSARCEYILSAGQGEGPARQLHSVQVRREGEPAADDLTGGGHGCIGRPSHLRRGERGPGLVDQHVRQLRQPAERQAGARFRHTGRPLDRVRLQRHIQWRTGTERGRDYPPRRQGRQRHHRCAGRGQPELRCAGPCAHRYRRGLACHTVHLRRRGPRHPRQRPRGPAARLSIRRQRQPDRRATDRSRGAHRQQQRELRPVGPPGAQPGRGRLRDQLPVRRRWQRSKGD
jgi:YD repeat-containing protein